MDAYTFGQKLAAKTPAWQRAEGQSESGGLTEAGRKSYEREHGGDLKAPVTESNPSGERAKRQNSFCSRMCGMKRVNTGSKTKSDPDSRINKSLRKWNCKCSSAAQYGVKAAFEDVGLDRFAEGYNAGTDNTNAHYQYNLGRGALSGTAVGLLHEGLRPKSEEEAKQTKLRKALRYLVSGMGGATLGTALRGGFAAATAPGGIDKSAGLGTALAKGTAREVDRYNQDVRDQNFENQDNPEYQPQGEVSDTSGALLALLLGGSGLALAHGPSLMQRATGRGRTKRASAKDIFDIVHLS